MQWYEAEVGELVTRLAANPVAHATVFYGSSSLRLWSTLAADLDNPRAVNAAFGGSTLEACAYFFERIVAPLHPASLVVYAGDNDLGDGRSPEHVLGSFRQLAVLVAECCGPMPFGFVSIKPSPSRFGIIEQIRATNALIRPEIEHRPNGYFIDVFDAMLRDGRPDPTLYTEDQLHLSRAGYERWASLLAPYRDRIFPPVDA
jgi:lysophospholipase L1-like esterase